MEESVTFSTIGGKPFVCLKEALKQSVCSLLSSDMLGLWHATSLLAPYTRLKYTLHETKKTALHAQNAAIKDPIALKDSTALKAAAALKAATALKTAAALKLQLL